MESESSAGHPAPTVFPGSTPPGLRSVSRAPLPHWRTPLIGRERLVADLVSLVRQQDVALVNLTGPGGVGKTRLAVAVASELANDFPDGIVFVPLDPLQDFHLVLPTIATAFGLSDTGIQRLEDRLIERLQPLQLLLVLDNMEHVIDAAPIISHVLAKCPNLTILATSRVVLHLTDEHDVRVEPLALPSAVELFVARARAASSTFALTADSAAAVARICARLDGVPLALELAAARTQTLPPIALMSRLDQSLPLLTSGARDQPDRLRTMRNAIAWSHDLLAPDEQRLFRQLAVFVSGFSLDAALSLAADEQEAIDTIGSLVDQSILQPIGHSDDLIPRYRMLETVREFGLEQLRVRGEELATRRCHAQWFADLAVAAQPHLDGGEQVSWQARLETELPNIRTALAWATQHDIELAMQLGASLQQFWIVRGNLMEAQRALGNVLQKTGGAPSLRGKTLLAAGWISVAQSEAPVGLELARTALDLFRAIGDRAGVADALTVIGFSIDASGHQSYDESMFASATEGLEEALMLGQELGNRRTVAMANYGLGSMAQRRGDVPGAFDFFTMALSDFGASDDHRSIAWVSSRIGDLAVSGGDVQRAAAAFEVALPIFLRLRDWWSAAQAVFGVARLAVAMGQPGEAVQLVASIDTFRAMDGLLPYLDRDAGRAALLKQARARLSDDEFLLAEGVGRHLNIEDAITQAQTFAHQVATKTFPEPSAAALEAAGLTQRERDVLRMLANGLSDREIADRLSLSPRTVGGHVTHLLAKLGVESRTAAAIHAIRYGLD